LNRLKAHLGVFAHAKQSGVVSPDYTVLRPITYDNPRFFELLFKSSPFISEFTKSTKGIVKGFWRLYTDDFYSIRAVVPPPEEQQQILKFIDSLTAQINKFIRNKRKQIELLQERRNALTYEAMKSKDTVWLRFGVVANQVERPIGREDALVYKPIGLFNRGRGIFHKEPTQGKELGDSTFFWVKPGDLVFSGQFAWEGAVAIAQPKDENCIASHRYPIFRNKPELVEAAFLYSFFTTKDGDLLLNLHSRGAAGRNRPLNPRTLGKEKIPIPPMDLQQEIARSLDLEFKFKNDVAKQISSIQEFRSRLIADVVTGQVDVRGINVPKVVDEINIGEEDDFLESVDLAGEDADMETEE
jgi:type I restriction enzyme S subunit